MPVFDTFVQELKYKVLREVASLAFDEALQTGKVMEIAERIIPDGKSTLRCCIYKERAIINERVALALGGNKDNPNVVEVLPIACDECPVDGIQVSASCRGCIAHRCVSSCPKDAITFTNHRANIDKTKCVECGRCLSACPYSAIVKNNRPCVIACKPKAIKINQETQKAIINTAKCTSCGACVNQCPFGAIMDKSFLTQAIALLNGSSGDTAYRVYAVVAPSIASQYQNITVEQVVAGIKALGFYGVVEAALGADAVAYLEAQELSEKMFLTSSCCPAFVSYVDMSHPAMAEHVSHTLSPMAQIAKRLKETDPGCKVVYIGPCIAKKAETLHTKAAEFVDCAITFEELQAMFGARGIAPEQLTGEAMEGASYFGRVFARSGGLAAAIHQALDELAIPKETFTLKAVSCNGISECRTALVKAQQGVLQENFIEGMACEGGCSGGPASLSRNARAAAQIDRHAKQACPQTIRETLQSAGMLP